MQGGGILPPEGKQGLAPINRDLLCPTPIPMARHGDPQQELLLHGVGDVGSTVPVIRATRPATRMLQAGDGMGAPSGVGGCCHPKWDSCGMGILATQTGCKQRK